MIKLRILSLLSLTLLISLAITILYITTKFIFYKLVDKRIANYQNDLVTKHYNEVENIYKQMRGWKHDYHNHIQTLKAYLTLGKYEDMDRYLNNLNDDLCNIDTVLKT